MATLRPVVSVYETTEDAAKKCGTAKLPDVMQSPLRPDLVRYIHTSVSKNRRQAISVGAKVGYETAAESWGTGRAVARIPRAPGGGTHRAGQGAFGNMCRGGGMFCPTKTWRRWHRRVNVTQKRHAVATALAASSLPALVMARGHRIGEIPELPLIVNNDFEKCNKTKDAIKTLKSLGCGEELQRVLDSKKIRAGKGKMRNRRYTMRCGPLVIYKEDNGITRALRNIPGVEMACVTRLNILRLAPGGHFGRFVIWTESAFKALKEVYGTFAGGCSVKRGYTLPRPQMENADVARIINSNEVQSVVRPKLEPPRGGTMKVNALKNKSVMSKLNPAAEEIILQRQQQCKEGTTENKQVQQKRKARMQAAKEYRKAHRGEKGFYNKLMKAFEAKAQKAEATEEPADE